MTNPPAFEPTEIWTPQSESFHLGEAIERARLEMNAENPKQLIHDLRNQVRRSENGIVYAILKGKDPKEYSDTDALVMFNPFANTATANMLVRTEFIRRVAEQANVRDSEGKLKSVVMLASPGLRSSHLKLSREEKRLISHGDLGPAANEYLKSVRGSGIGRVALLGYSQGADTAVAGARGAYRSDLDISSLAIGEPAGTIKRLPPKLAIDFFTAAPDIDARAKATGLAALDAAHGFGEDYRKFVISATYPTNWRRLAFGMSAGSFEENMQEVLDEGKIDKIVVGYGNSKISPPAAMENSLAKLRAGVGGDKITSIKIQDGTHAWGEQLTVLAKLYLRSLV